MARIISLSIGRGLNMGRGVESVMLCKERKYSIASNLKLIHSLKKFVNPFGSIELEKVPASIIIRPANPVEYPNMDTAILKLLAANLSNATKCDLIVKDSSSLKVNLFGSEDTHSESDLVLLLELPIKYEIKAALEENHSVTVESMEPDSVDVTTSSGSVVTKNLKCGLGRIQTDSGNITCTGGVQGNIKISSSTGNIIGGRFQGPSMEMKTASGNIEVDSVYSDVSLFQSETGNLNLRNLHQQSTVHILKDGNLKIMGMDGSINATLGSGCHEVQISQLRSNSTINVKGGELHLRIPQENNFGLKIKSNAVSLPKTTMYDQINEKEIFVPGACSDFVVNVECDGGKVTLENQDWFSALGLKFQS